MARKANPAEERVLQSLRQTNVITKAKMDECIALLEATEACDKCAGTGNSAPPGQASHCGKCQSTGQMLVIR